MDTLPTELLHAIFTLLPIVQKQECILVCQRWAHVIRTRSLLHTVSLADNKLLLNKFMEMIKQKPELGTQVECLNVYSSIYHYWEQHEEEIFHVFPNLKMIRMNKSSFDRNGGANRSKNINDNNNNNQEILVNESAPFKCRLTHIFDSGECTLARKILATNACPRLVRLSLYHKFESNGNNSNKSILPLLKETPLLESLLIFNATITMDELEALHDNVPSLKVLNFFNCKLLKGNVPIQISPASFTTSLYISLYDLQQHHLIEWPHYISRKYPSLSKFAYTARSNGVSMNELKKLLEQGYPLVLQALGRKLQALSLIGVDRDPTILKKLDIIGCETKNLTLYSLTEPTLEALAQSDQSKFIERLSLYDIPFLSLECLKTMSSLKHLQLNFQDTRDFENVYDLQNFFDIRSEKVNLTRILQQCPNNVESVSISTAHIYFGLPDDCSDNNEVAYQKFPIKDLEISDALMSSGFDTFVTQCLPNLQKLKLDYEIKKGANLRFPNHHFSDLTLDFEFNDYDLVFTTLDNGKTSVFSKRKKASCTDYSVLGNGITPISKQELFGDEFITVVCASTKHLYLNTEHAYL